jgi:hypothetical protein
VYPFNINSTYNLAGFGVVTTRKESPADEAQLSYLHDRSCNTRINDSRTVTDSIIGDQLTQQKSRLANFNRFFSRMVFGFLSAQPVEQFSGVVNRPMVFSVKA